MTKDEAVEWLRTQAGALKERNWNVETADTYGQIADLLERAVVPQFKMGDEVWVRYFGEDGWTVAAGEVQVWLTYEVTSDTKGGTYDSCDVFATQAEAQAACDRLNGKG